MYVTAFSLVKQQLRGRTALLFLLILLIADTIARAGTKVSPKLILAGLAIAFWYVSTTTINDLSDEEVDAVNLTDAQDRPLMNGSASRNGMYILYGASAAAAGICGLLIRPMAAVVVGVAVALGYIYSMPPIRVSSRGIWAQLLLPLGYAGLPFTLAYIVNNQYPDRTGIIFFAGIYVAFIGRLLLKDFRDYEGDKKFGKLTFLVRHGSNATCIVAILAWIMADVLIGAVILPQLVLLAAFQIFIAALIYGLLRLRHAIHFSRQMLLIGFINQSANAITLITLAAVTLMYTHITTRVEYIYILVICTGIFLVQQYYQELKENQLLPFFLSR